MELTISDGHAVYRGPVGGGPIHRHGAYQGIGLLAQALGVEEEA